MKKPTCKAVREVLFDYIGNDLPKKDLDAIEVHLNVCESCREDLEICAGLPGALGSAPMDELSFNQLRKMTSLAVQPPQSASKVSMPAQLVAFSLSAAAAVIIAITTWVHLTNSSDQTEPTSPPQMGTTVETFVERTEMEIIPGPGAETKLIHSFERELQYRQTRGIALYQIGPAPLGTNYVINTPRAHIQARGTVFSVEVTDEGDESVVVCEGDVLVSPKEGNTQTLVPPGYRFTVGEDEPQIATTGILLRDLTAAQEGRFIEGVHPSHHAPMADGSSKTPLELALEISKKRRGISDSETWTQLGQGKLDRLLDLAHSYRRIGSYNEAAHVYTRISRSSGGTPAAAESLVNLGQLQMIFLDDPCTAAESFRSYMSKHPEGPLIDIASTGAKRAQAACRSN